VHLYRAGWGDCPDWTSEDGEDLRGNRSSPGSFMSWHLILFLGRPCHFGRLCRVIVGLSGRRLASWQPLRSSVQLRFLRCLAKSWQSALGCGPWAERREIKNLIRPALAVAVYKNEPLTEDTLRLLYTMNYAKT